MALAGEAADLAISRSGAGTLAEALEFEVPLILIPFQHAADNHQEKNADFMVQTVGGAEKILQPHLTGALLSASIDRLFQNEGAQLQQMRNSMAAYKDKGTQKE